VRKASVLIALLCGLSLLFIATAAALAGGVAGAGAPSVLSASADTGRGPLVVVGMVMLAAGVVLLRRPVVIPTR